MPIPENNARCSVLRSDPLAQKPSRHRNTASRKMIHTVTTFAGQGQLDLHSSLPQPAAASGPIRLEILDAPVRPRRKWNPGAIPFERLPPYRHEQLRMDVPRLDP